MPNDGCILVFTSRSVRQMRSQGGSQAWVLDPKRARRQPYLVTAWNSLGEHVRTTGGRHHGQAFLVAPITGIERAATPLGAPRRYVIQFEKYKRIEVPDVWPHGQRNPVFYTTLHDLGINLEELEFAADLSDSEPS